MFRSSRLLLCSVSATAIAFSAPAYAQQEETQVEAQDINTAIECSTISDPAERQECIDTQGENAIPEAGATGEGTIIVTGSRIRRPNFESLEPAVVINSAQIESRGFETLGQALNEQPSFGVPGASPVGAGQAGSFGSGQSFVNFLGLGSQRTLTLVNGRRFVSSNTASIFGPTAAGLQVDLNSINTKLVDRVETIAIGGAPIYGSDAIAGTINVLLKRDYEGLELDAQYGLAEQGDAPNWRIRGILGMNFADGRGNVTLSGEYNEGTGLVYNDREITRAGEFYADCPEGSRFNQCIFPARRIPAISESGIPTVGSEFIGLNFPVSPEQMEFLIFGDPSLAFGVLDPSGNQVQFGPGGEFIPINFGNPVGCIPCGDFNIDFSGGNGFNIFNVLQLLTDTQRYNANILAQYNITDNIRVFAEGWYAYSKGTNLRNQPVYNSGLFDAAGTADGPIIIDIDNPFLTEDQRTLIQNNINNNPLSDQNILCTLGIVCDYLVQDFFYLTRANTDIISGQASTATNLYRGILGVDGTFAVGGREWQWEVVGNHGYSKTKGREPVLVQQNFENAVDAVLDANGNIVCRPGFESAPIATLSSTCAPLNLFGSGQMSQAALDYITTIADPTGVNKQWVGTASVTGPVATLPGGDLSVAFGVEARKESTDFDPGEFYFGYFDEDGERQQFGRSIPINPVKGSYNTKEAFSEIRAPIFGPANNIPGIRTLELHGAVRYVDHSTAGGDWTYTVEGRWGIVRDLAIRGNFTRAIRAPAITELFNPSSQFFGFAVDPCDEDNLGSGPDPATRQANCAAAGLPPTFQSLSSQRSFHQAIAGNENLANEKSNAWSVGVVLNPRFIPDLSITADYIDIKLKDAISAFSGTGVVTACYDAPDYPDNQFCDRVQRDATGQLSFVETSYFNASEFHYQGVLAALDYGRRTPFLGAQSRVGINLTYQFLKTLELTTIGGAAATTLDRSLGYPKHSAAMNVNYKNGPFGMFTSFNYTGKVNQQNNVQGLFREHNRINDVLFVDTGISFDIDSEGRGVPLPGGLRLGRGMTFRFIVDNVFNTDPPYPVPAFGGVVTYFPGILGRYYRVGASVRF
jgi:iron complex outermembrane recepter protein